VARCHGRRALAQAGSPEFAPCPNPNLLSDIGAQIEEAGHLACKILSRGLGIEFTAYFNSGGWSTSTKSPALPIRQDFTWEEVLWTLYTKSSHN